MIPIFLACTYSAHGVVHQIIHLLLLQTLQVRKLGASHPLTKYYYQSCNLSEYKITDVVSQQKEKIGKIALQVTLDGSES